MTASPGLTTNRSTRLMAFPYVACGAAHTDADLSVQPTSPLIALSLHALSGIAAAFVLAVSVYAVATPDQSAGHRAAPRMEAVQ